MCVAPAAPPPLWAVPGPPGHEKRTPTDADAHDLKIVVKLRAVPASKVPFPVEIAGFPDFSRPVPVYPAFLKYVVPVHLSALVGRLGEKYNFNREINDVRISRERVMLPVHEGVPDYEYIEKITQQKRQTMLNKYRIYAQKCIADLGDESELPALSEKTWDSFSISDIFDILPGKRLVAADTTPGDRPFIGALDNSNGIARFVNDTNVSLDKNVLGVNYDGNGMVIGFYHPYECIFSDSVKRFHLKNHEDKAFVLLFMKVAILQQKSKFGYLYKFNAERMANTRIMLPVTDDGTPDYEYMEQYAKNLMSRKYKQYLAYLDSKGKTDTIATSD